MTVKKAQTPLVCHGHTRPIVELSYSPVTPDGYFLTSASKDGQPMLRNGETGDWIGTFLGHKGAVWSCVLNEPAMLAATASADFTARVWNALTGEELHLFPHQHIARTVHFSKHGNRLVTGGHEKLLRIFDLGRQDAEPLMLSGAVAPIRCASWHQDDNLLLSTYLDQPNVHVWDVRSQKIVQTLETGGVVTSLEVVPGGQYITTAAGQDVQFWDGATLQCIAGKTHSRPANQGKAFAASVCPSKRRFLVGGENCWVHLLDWDTGEEVDCNKGHHGPVHCVRFAPGGESYASGSEDGTIRIWQTDFAPQEDGDANSHAAAPEPAANGAARQRLAQAAAAGPAAMRSELAANSF